MNYEIKDNKLILHVNDIDKTIKKTKKLIRLCDKKNLELVIDGNTNDDLDMIKTAINIKKREDRYNYIYDKVCKNYCEFENDVCIRFKKENPNHKNGCCEWKGRGKCKYLINSVCTMKTCMACKLFTCPFLYKEKGIRQRINDYVLIKYFFNNNQKYILECSFWTPKEIVMKRLLANKFNINE